MPDITTITLPSDETLKARLTKKLNEYRDRKKPCQAPEIDQDTRFKVAILATLLEKGEVNVQKIRTAHRRLLGHAFDKRLFKNAVKVINAYIVNDLRHMVGGTGLPE